MTKSRPIRCECFGGFRLFDADNNEVRISVIKGAAIIAFLLLSGRQKVSRAFLAGLLWSEKTEAQSRTALRQCFHQLRHQLSDAGLDIVQITADAVELNRVNVTTDVDILLDGHLPTGLGVSNFNADRLLYGFEDLDPSFREWLWETRHRTQGQISTKLSARLENSSSKQERLKVATLLNALNPALELAARPLIEEHIRVGNIVDLLGVYKQLWDALEEEWEEEPSEELQILVGDARARLAKTLPAPDAGTKERDGQDFRRKYLCVLALKLNGDLPADHVDAFLQAARVVLLAKEARLIAHQGCDLCAVFGLPVSREGDARNVVEAAMVLRDLHAKFARQTPQHQSKLSIGIDTGTLGVSDYTAHQEPLNLRGSALDQATALALQPSDNAIFATERTVRRLRHLFVSLNEEMPNQSDRVARIIGRNVESLDTSALAISGSAFIGRAPFLAALRFALMESLEGSLQIVSIQGAAGIGKTRLVHEFLAELISEGTRTLAINCSRYDRSAPLEPILDLSRQLQPDDTREQHDAKSLLSRETASGEAETFEVGHSIAQGKAETIANLINQEPTVIFVDEWQWVDDASRKALQQITELARDFPVLLILVSRDLSVDDGIVRTSHQVHLPPLNIREVKRKAEDLLQRPIDEMLCAELYTKSGGNPLFLEEICFSIDQEPGGEPLGHLVDSLPANLRAMIASKIEQLEPEDAEIVLALAVHGEVLDTDLLANVLQREITVASLDRLCALDILSMGVTEKEMRFKHGITRDVAYDLMPQQKRETYHGAYFQALSETVETQDQFEMLEVLALHARKSGHIEAALDLCEQAGDKALAVSSLDQAQRQFHAALNMIDQLNETVPLKRRWLSIVLRWAQPCVYSASIDQIPVLERAEKIALDLDDNTAVAAIRYWIGYIYLVLGDYELAIDALQNAQAHAQESTSPRLSAEITAIQGFTLAAKGEDQIAQQKIKQAIDAKDKNPGKLGRAPVTSAYARATLAVIRADQGDFDAAEDLIEDALDRVSEFKHEIESSILNMGAAVYLWRGDWAKAIDMSTRSCKRAERVRASYLMGMSQCVFNYASWKQDRDPQSIKGLETAATWLEAKGMRLYQTFVFGWLADALVDQGRFSQAKRAASQAILQSQTGESVGVPMAYRSLARSELGANTPNMEAALEHLQQADRWADLRSSEHERGNNALVEAEIHVFGQNQQDASSALSRATETFTRLGMPEHQALAETLKIKL